MLFGELLRQWRSARHLSQLGLAMEAGISTRHLSFLETGRSQPSREMVQLLTGILDVPAGERNALLVSAGFAPMDGAVDGRASDLVRAEQALRLILKKHEPYPALVLDGGWNIVMENDGAKHLFGMLKRDGSEREPANMNVVRAVFNPRGFRQFMVNWEPIAECHIQGLNREIAATGSQQIMKLRDEALSYPGVPARWKTPGVLASVPMTMQLKSGDLELSFQSTMTTLGSPGGSSLQLRIEQFFPADSVTDEVARSLACGDPIVL
jgi:transcriptional regulator with XRE-family HTH domain